MFGAKKDKEEYKIEIKFEKKDKVEKEPLPFIMFLKKFCETFCLSTEDLNTKESENPKYDYFTTSKYDFYFYYRDSDDEDKVIVSTADDFLIFYKNPDCYENVSTTRHLFLEKNEKEGDDIIKAYNEIINKENFKNISITVYINEDIEEEKKEENIENKANKANNEEEKKKKKNNDCPYCNGCLDCF